MDKETLVKEFENAGSMKEAYDVCVKGGCKATYEEFCAKMNELLAESNKLSDVDLEKVNGGCEFFSKLICTICLPAAELLQIFTSGHYQSGDVLRSKSFLPER